MIMSYQFASLGRVITAVSLMSRVCLQQENVQPVCYRKKKKWHNAAPYFFLENFRSTEIQLKEIDNADFRTDSFFFHLIE